MKSYGIADNITTPIRYDNVVAFVWSVELLARVNMDLGVRHVEFQSGRVPNRSFGTSIGPFVISVIKARIYILLIFYDTGLLLFLLRLFFLLKSSPAPSEKKQTILTLHIFRVTCVVHFRFTSSSCYCKRK